MDSIYTVVMQDKWTGWVSAQGKWSRCTCLSDVRVAWQVLLRLKMAQTRIPYTSVHLCLCLCICNVVCACLCVGGLCLIIPYSLWGRRIHSRSDNEGETSNALKSFLLFFHPSCCIRLLSPLIRPSSFFFQRRTSIPSSRPSFPSAFCQL